MCAKWACELTEDAEADLRALPKGIPKRVAHALTQMPNVWHVVFRCRIGDYRVLFTVEQNGKRAFIIRILGRSEKTYR